MKNLMLPSFNENGDLPEGTHVASLEEMLARFRVETEARGNAARNLEMIYTLARSTESLERFIVFGSFITSKLEPNDVDVILVMKDEFDHRTCSDEMLALLDHRRASDELGASCFWVRPAMLFGESVENFIAGWSVKRGGGRRGLVEIVP